MKNFPEQWTGERTIWPNPADHLKEFKQISNYYFEAMERAKDKSVIDVGAGLGFGSFMLSLVATRVDAVDISVPSVLLEPKYKLPFQCDGAFHKLNLDKDLISEEADICVAIELLEHLENPDFFLENLKTRELFFTIPCYGDKNPFHKIEYDEEKAAALVRRHFPHLEYRMESRRMIGFATR